MKRLLKRTLVLSMVSMLAFGPGVINLAFAQDDQEAASSDDVKAVQQLANKGYLGDKKDQYLSAKSLTDDEVTDALIAIYDHLKQVDLKSLTPQNGGYKVEDLALLQQMVNDRSEQIRAKKVSAWTFNNRLKKMIEALSPRQTMDSTPAATTHEKTEAAVLAPVPTATPIPGPSRAEWDDMKSTIKDLSKKLGDLEDTYDKKIGSLQKSDEDTKAAMVDVKNGNADNLEQLKLVKKLLDRVQDDLKKTDDHLDEVEKKASQKSITDTQLQQELDIMHKDLRDDTQDVSVLKQEVAKLSKEDAHEGQSPLDELLASKWVAGGALLVGLTALVVSLVRK